MKHLAVVVVSGLAAVAAVVLDVGGAIQLAIVAWFLVACPGLGFVRALRLAERELEVALVVGLGVAVDATASLALVAAGVYGPLQALIVILVVAAAGAVAADLDVARATHPATAGDGAAPVSARARRPDALARSVSRQRSSRRRTARRCR